MMGVGISIRCKYVMNEFKTESQLCSCNFCTTRTLSCPFVTLNPKSRRTLQVVGKSKRQVHVRLEEEGAIG